MKLPKRLNKKILQEDLDAYAALKAIADYNPSNPQYKMSNIDASHDTMGAGQTSEVQTQAAADAARDAAANGEWNFHDDILGVKEQVKAQYGADSDEYQALGMKKKSEYNRPRRKPSGGNV